MAAHPRQDPGLGPGPFLWSSVSSNVCEGVSRNKAPRRKKSSAGLFAVLYFFLFYFFTFVLPNVSVTELLEADVFPAASWARTT